MPTKMSDEELFNSANELARKNGMYIVSRLETRHGKEVMMYLLFRRLHYAPHGTMIGKRNSAASILKLVTKAKEIK